MRKLVIFTILVLIVCSCAKAPDKPSAPVLTYKSFLAWKVNGKDTSNLIFHFVDGDGNLFVDPTNVKPNFVLISYYYNNGTKSMVQYNVTSSAITQPPKTNYQGQLIQGDILYPSSQYRSADSVKIVQFSFFMVDNNNTKSNVVTTPTIQLNY
ncbi:MAG: hypothetical protein JSU07_12195 [Bacteroidetes bacterium]|nr:hypothetical protein [Bacteroidota bacterium]